MQSVRSLILGGLLGALWGWLLCATVYYWKLRWNRYDFERPWGWLRQPLPESFWRTSAYLTLAGAAVGVTIAAIKLVL